MKLVLLLSQFYKWKRRGTERLSNLLVVTQLVADTTMIEAQVSDSRNDTLLHHTRTLLPHPTNYV